MKKVLSSVIASAVVATSAAAGIPASAEYNSTAPTDLKAELLEEALGIDPESPCFSWTMNSGENNITQQAYRIVIAQTAEKMADEAYIFDTSWVESDENTNVAVDYGFDYNSLYYWRVQTKDNNNRISDWSDMSVITTAVGDKWESTDGIWGEAGVADSNPYFTNGWTDYTVEMDLNIIDVAAGIMLRAQDGSNYYMWQIKPGHLYPHVWKNGSPVGNTYVADVGLTEKGVNIELNKTFRVKFNMNGNTINTYIDTSVTGNGFVLVDSRDVSAYGISYGTIGFRTGRSESFTVDNIKVYNDSGELYNQNFSDETVNHFVGAKVENGALSVPLAQNNGIRMSGYYDELLAEKSNYVFLRHEFDIRDRSKIDRAIVSVTARSPESIRQYVYNLYLNGDFVGLGPARFGKNTIYYNTFDVTDLLKNGKNAIGAINYTKNDKSFLMQMTVFYKDGTKQILLNSGRDRESFKYLDGTNAFGDNGNSIGTGFYNVNAENLNAKYYPFGWNEAGFDDSAWKIPVSRGNISENRLLKPYPADNVGREYFDIKSVEKQSDGSYLVDFGKEVVGGMKLTVNSPSAATLTIRSGEELNNGAVQYQMNTGNKYEEFWTLTEGEQTLENIGMKTVRYVSISGIPTEITADMIKAVAIRQEFNEEESEFNSSDEMLNKIYDTMKYTIQATNQDLYTDSQSRERGAYEGDALINMMSSYSFEDDYTLARFTNEWLDDNPTWPSEYKLFSINTAWLDYQYTGNKKSIETYYDTLKGKLFDSFFNESLGLINGPYLGSSSSNAILVDWPASERDGYDYDNAQYNTVVNAVSYSAYCDMAKIAAVLGKTDDAEKYSARAEVIKANMISRLYNSETGAFCDGLNASGNPLTHCAQHATVFALACGVYTDSEMTAKMADYIRSQGEIRMSVYGSYFLLDGLYNAGAGDLALELMANKDTSEGARSWAYMIETLGATISTEAWNETNKPNMTYSHPWGSAPASQIVRGLFGIKPTSEGYSEFQIKLQPGNLEYASVKVPTIKGSISAAFNQSNPDSVIDATVTVPANTKAMVSLPAGDFKENYIIIDGKAVSAVRDGDFLAVTLGSGTYELSVRTETPFLQGDLDGDGKVTVSDVVALRKEIMSGEFIDGALQTGDMDGDGKLTVSDVVALRKKIMEG